MKYVVTAPIQRTLTGSDLTFSINVQDAKLHIVHAGRATNNALNGTATLGDFGEAPFTGRRT